MLRCLALAVACTGCVALPGSVEASGSGVSSGIEVQSLRCPGSATVDRYAAGSGAVSIQVSDGTNESVYTDRSNVTGEVNDSHDVDGVPGEWRLTVDPGGFAGQYKITLSCL